MPLPIESVNYGVFGGLNVADPPDTLVERSHSFAGGRWIHRTGSLGGIMPVESPQLQNIDFERNEIRKRKGSTEAADFTATGLSIFLSGDVVVRGFSWKNPATGAVAQFIVSKKTIYTDQSGTWAQINNAAGVAYTHSDQTVTLATFTPHDRHLFIGINGTNAIQVYRTGADLDDQLNNNTTATTVDASSSSGQKVLNVAVTTMFLVNDRIVIDSAGTPEYGYIASIQAGVSITLQANLGATYTIETVAVANEYTETFGGTQQAVTGSWDTGHYMVESSHGHLAFCNGDTVVEFCAVDAPYDRVNGGFWLAREAVVGMKAFTPKFASEMREVIFLFTEIGFEYFGGFEVYDRLEKIDAAPPMNHQSIIATDKWLMYLTSQGEIKATQGAGVINLGRRLRANDGSLGPLDSISLTNSATIAFGFYNSVKKQGVWGIASGATAVVDTLIVLDLQLGEPRGGESLQAYESHTRWLKWTGLNYVTMWQNIGNVAAAIPTGFIYTIESGESDFDTVAIDARYRTPEFNAGWPFNQKQFLDLFVQVSSRGDWDVFINYFEDSLDVSSGQFVFSQGIGQSVYDTAVYDTATYSDLKAEDSSDDIDLVAKSLQLEIFNEAAGQPFSVMDIEMRYQQLREER